MSYTSENLAIPILYVTPSSGPSGANFSLIRLLQNLDRTRFAPLVACPRPVNELLQEEMNALDVPLIPVYMEEWGQMVGEQMSLRRILAWPKRMGLRGRTIVKLARMARQRGIGVVHTNSVLAVEGALAAKLARIPHVWHVRDRVGPEGSVQFRAGLDKAVRRIRSLSHTIVTISDYVREPFKSLCLPEQLRTIHNSVDLLAYLSAGQQPNHIRQEFGVPPGAPLLATVGHITPEKRQEDFIRAAARIREVFPDAKFLLVGKILDFHHAYHESLKGLIMSLDLQESVIFTGLRRDIPAIFSAIDLMIHPRTNEGFGRVIIEAMAAGKPVVTVRTGGPAEIVQDRVTGRLVKPKDPNELANAAIEILQKPEIAQEMGKMGREDVAQRFTDAVYVANIERVYGTILGERPHLAEEICHAHGQCDHPSVQR